VAGYNGHGEKGHIFSTHWNMEHTFARQVIQIKFCIVVMFASPSNISQITFMKDFCG